MSSSTPRAQHAHAIFLLVAAALVAFAAPLQAQVDIESLRRGDARAGVSGSFGSDLTLRTGNVDLVQLDLTGRLNWARASAVTLLIGNGGIGFLDGTRFSSSGLLHLRQTYRPGRRLDPEWYAQINYDRPQRLDFRALAGAGARLQLSAGEWGAVGVGASVMYEHERLDLPETAVHTDRTETWRNSTFVSLRIVGGDQLMVTSTAYLQPALRDVLGDLRVLESLRVAASLTERLALTVTFDLRYDSGPPDGIASLDTRLKTGLSFTY